MKIKTPMRCAFFCLLVWVGVFAVIGTAQALTIHTIRGAPNTDKIRLVLELDDVADFRAFVADAPTRLVVELPADGLAEDAMTGLTRLGINEMRQSRQGAMMRLDFMLQYPVKIAQAFMLPRVDGKPDRLVIDYKRVDAGAFRSATTQTLGTLSGRSNVNVGDQGSGILGVLPRPGQRIDGAAPPRNANSGENAVMDAVVIPSPDPQEKKASVVRRYVIAVDAGHGGKDPGAVGRGNVYEKHITLAAAKELAKLLEQSGRYKVILTRASDKFILLPERVRIARRNGADLFVSLHADMAAGNSDASGLSIYTLSDTASDAQTEKLAASENKVDLLAGIDLSHEQEDVANILIDLAMRENMNQSRFFAGKVVKTMDGQGIDLLPRPHRYAGFAVLKAPDIPSVLVEMGFLSNPSEARRLQDDAHRRKLMQGLKNGIDGYFTQLEKNAGE